VSFFDDAQRVFETAAQGSGAADLGILVDDSGALRIVDAVGWRPEALQAHYGARTVFQVSRDAAGVRVAARSGSRACTLSVEQPASILDLGGAVGLLSLLPPNAP
jgi:hypothetical protein